jgi:hypothetical protein
MPVIANTTFRKIVVASLARPTVEKRRSLNRVARPSTECISKKAAPPVSTISSEKLSEAEAIRRAHNGDRSVFEYLYRLHSRRIYALCLRMVGNTTEAEDLTQEAFLFLLRKIHTFLGESAFSTWLHRLAVNLVLMRLRKKSPPFVPIEATPDPDDETFSPSIDIGAPDLLLEGSAIARGLPQNICLARYSGVRAQRDGRGIGTLGRRFEVAVAQGPHAAA